MQPQDAIERRLILAVDMLDNEPASVAVRTFGNELSWYKVRQSQIRSTRQHASNAKILCDRRFTDLSARTADMVSRLVDEGCDMFTVYGLAGRKTIESAVKFKGHAKALVVTVPTWMCQEDLMDLGFPSNLTIPELVVRLARIARETGADGIVSSALELDAVNSELGNTPDFIKVTPAIRLESTVLNDDQKRTSTPIQALERNADLIIVGRPITNARDRRKALAQYFENMRLAVRAQELVLAQAGG